MNGWLDLEKMLEKRITGIKVKIFFASIAGICSLGVLAKEIFKLGVNTESLAYVENELDQGGV